MNIFVLLGLVFGAVTASVVLSTVAANYITQRKSGDKSIWKDENDALTRQNARQATELVEATARRIQAEQEVSTLRTLKDVTQVINVINNLVQQQAQLQDQIERMHDRFDQSFELVIRELGGERRAGRRQPTGILPERPDQTKE